MPGATPGRRTNGPAMSAKANHQCRVQYGNAVICVQPKRCAGQMRRPVCKIPRSRHHRHAVHGHLPLYRADFKADMIIHVNTATWNFCQAKEQDYQGLLPRSGNRRYATPLHLTPTTHRRSDRQRKLCHTGRPYADRDDQRRPTTNWQNSTATWKNTKKPK